MKNLNLSSIFLNKNIGSTQRYTAFTLAEVLITLGIIGIVAAYTIPTLISNSQKQGYAKGLEKFYSSFSQVLQQYAYDDGSIGDLSKTTLFTSNTHCVPSTCYSYGGEGEDPGFPCDSCTPDGVFSWTILGKYYKQIKDCSTSEIGRAHV